MTPDGYVFPTRAVRFSHTADEVPVTTITLDLIGVSVDLAGTVAS